MRTTWKIRIALALNFFVFAILLNTVGIVIARVIEDYGVSGGQAATLYIQNLHPYEEVLYDLSDRSPSSDD